MSAAIALRVARGSSLTLRGIIVVGGAVAANGVGTLLRLKEGVAVTDSPSNGIVVKESARASLTGVGVVVVVENSGHHGIFVEGGGVVAVQGGRIAGCGNCGVRVQPVAAPSWAARTAGASRAVSAWRRRGQRAAAAQRSLSAPMRLGRSYSRRGVAKHTDLLSHQYLQNACLSKGPCTIWKSSGRPSTATRSSYKR